MATTIYHNPRCSKSRQTLQLLNDNDVNAEVIEYLKTPPDAKTLKDILGKLGLKPRQLMRTKEDIYKELNLDDAIQYNEDALALIKVCRERLEQAKQKIEKLVQNEWALFSYSAL